jgi:hypothetical protein
MQEANMKRSIIVLVVLMTLAGCSTPTQDPAMAAQDTLAAQNTLAVAPTDTPVPSPTYTREPTRTPEPTKTPAPTSTPEPTSTPVQIDLFQSDADTVIYMLENPMSYIGVYVKFIADGSSDVYVEGVEVDSTSAIFPIQKKSIRIKAEITKQIDHLEKPENISYGYVYAQITGEMKYRKNNTWVTESDSPLVYMPIVEVHYYEPIEDAKKPKYNGYYKVGSDIAPGYWQSAAEMTVGGCYWERIDSAGNIIDNHFGVAGITVYVAQTDTVVRFDDCGVMFYIGNY